MKEFIQKFKSINLMRRVIQLVAFILLPGLISSVFYAIKDIYIAILRGNASTTSIMPSILLLIAVIPITALMGRFFCGFICSFGAMGDFLWFISTKIKLGKKIKIGEKADSKLKLIKYGILLFLFIGVWTFNLVTFDSMSSPWTVFGMYASFGSWPSLKYLISIGGLLLLLIIIGSLLVERFFCKYLCPLGAVLAIVSKIRVFRISKIREKCGSCRICTSKCSMGIPLYQYDKITSGECINCFACIQYCPRKNAKVNPAPAVATAASVAAISGLVYVGNVVSGADMGNLSKNPVTADINASTGKYTDGTYTGSADGFRGETSVSVTVEKGYITDITILSFEDDQEYFNRAANSIISSIIESQDVNVDAVSGATFSSNGIMEAVSNALSDGKVVNNSEGNSSVKDAAKNTDTAEKKENASSDTEADTAKSGQQEFKDGTYTGTGTGFRGETEVSVTVSDGKITDITVSSFMDDDEFFYRAQDNVIADIIESQNVNVDAVSGATFSSNGIMEAVANALGVSYTNTNDTNSRRGHGGPGRRH